MRLLAVAALITLAACGSAGQSHITTSPAATAPAESSASLSTSSSTRGQVSPPPSPRALSTALFVIATGLPGGQLVNDNGQAAQATVQIADATGRVHATATFKPPPLPNIGYAQPLLQSPIRTAGGAAYYADSTGAVHRLRPDGSTSVVATFPLTSGQQELSYAVSPDGVHLIAIILSTPPLHVPPPQQLGDPVYVAGGHWNLKVEIADAGGATSTTLQRDLGTNYPQPTQIVGWDAHGPLATLNTQLGAQQEPNSAHIWGSPLIHIGPDGTHLDAIGGSDCIPMDEIPNGTVLCGSVYADAFSVRSSSGSILWQAGLGQNNYYPGMWLSPDANAVAAQGIVVTRDTIASASRDNGAGSSLISLGWLDANTVFVATPEGQISLYDAYSFTRIRDLGLFGLFEGLL